MASAAPTKSEYSYFSTFVKHTKTKISTSPALNFLQLQCILMELGELLINKKHDKDDIRFKCGDIMATTFLIAQDIPQLRPCFPSTKLHHKWSLDLDQSGKLPLLMTASKEIMSAYIQLSTNSWDSSTFNNLQEKLDNFTYTIWEISNTPEIHSLLSLQIQITSHYHILMEKQQIISYKPFMKTSFESKSIYPWKYNWNHYSLEFLEYINQCGKIRLGIEYSIEEIVEILKDIIYHKQKDHNIEPEAIQLELSYFLNTPTEEINIDDANTLQYPLLFHLTSKTYEEIWHQKHKSSWRTPLELKKSHIQILASVKYPPCPTHRNVTPDPPSPNYSDNSDSGLGGTGIV
jgi:hypothetical protein